MRVALFQEAVGLVIGQPGRTGGGGGGGVRYKCDKATGVFIAGGPAGVTEKVESYHVKAGNLARVRNIR